MKLRAAVWESILRLWESKSNILNVCSLQVAYVHSAPSARGLFLLFSCFNFPITFGFWAFGVGDCCPATCKSWMGENICTIRCAPWGIHNFKGRCRWAFSPMNSLLSRWISRELLSAVKYLTLFKISSSLMQSKHLKEKQIAPWTGQHQAWTCRNVCNSHISVFRGKRTQWKIKRWNGCSLHFAGHPEYLRYLFYNLW